MRDRNRFLLFSWRQGAVALAATLALFAGFGCNSGVPLATSLIPVDERLRGADTSISEAVDDYGKGQQAAGDAALNRAVILLTISPDEEFKDEGYIDVAKRVAMKGRPQDAVRLLTPLKTDVSKSNPLFWGALAEASKLAGDTPGATEANQKANAAAEAILKTAGGAIPSKREEAARKAMRFLRVGGYYDEYVQDYSKALQALREARRLLPNESITANALGYTLANRGTTTADFNEAVQLTYAAVDKAPDNPAFLDSYGWALFKRNNTQSKDLEGARRLLRQAVDLAPDLAECRFHLATVYEKLGLLPDALREAERTLYIQPDYNEAKVLRDRLKPLVAASPSPSPSASPTPAPSASPSPAASPSPTVSASPTAAPSSGPGKPSGI